MRSKALVLAIASLTSCSPPAEAKAPVRPTPVVRPSPKVEDLMMEQKEAQRDMQEAATRAAEIKERLYRAEQHLK